MASSTLISIFENRIEFTSIGGLVKGITYEDIMLGISITRNEVDEYLDVSQSTSNRILNSMLYSGLIKSVGKGKSTRYERV
ncbi:MAG: hypothetical protein GX815_13160 [Clostridiales bacterium]|nr:hypothetical protein [Clostridiales bacterium]